jgi:hypothetical protein
MTATPTGGTGTVSYQWQSGTASTSMSDISGATNTTYAPGVISTTTYYRAIASFTGSGCDAATATAIAKTLYPPLSPGSLTTTSTTVCAGATVAAISPSAPSGGNGTYTYQWKEGTGNATGAANTDTFTPAGTYLTTPGTYRFTRTVASCGATSTTPGTFTLVVLPNPTITLTTGSSNLTLTCLTEILPPQSPLQYTVYSPNGTFGIGYSGFSGLDFAKASSTIVLHGTPTEDGVYNYWLSVHDDYGCADTVSGTITVTHDYPNWTSCSSTQGYAGTDGDNYSYYDAGSHVQDGTRTGFTYIALTHCDGNTTNTGNWAEISQFCQRKGTGWRMPTLAELKCINDNRSSLPNPNYFSTNIGYSYWSATRAGSGGSYNYYTFSGYYQSSSSAPYDDLTNRPMLCVK